MCVRAYTIYYIHVVVPVVINTADARIKLIPLFIFAVGNKQTYKIMRKYDYTYIYLAIFIYYYYFLLCLMNYFVRKIVTAGIVLH